ncbi:MAG: hypothetical protein WCP61_06350 [Chitinophagia bacterium]
MKQFNKRIFFGFAALLLLFTITIYSCNKNQLHVNQKVIISDSILAKQISISTEFESILLNISDIKTSIKNNSLSQQERIIDKNDFNEAASIKNENALKIFLLKLGYKNADIIVKNTLTNNTLFLEAFAAFPELYKRDKERVLAIFKFAFLLSKSDTDKSIKPFMLADDCSKNYAYGIEDCSEALSWDLIAAQIGLVLPTPVNLGITLTLSGLAYLKEYSCKINVVKRWQACRASNPI